MIGYLLPWASIQPTSSAVPRAVSFHLARIAGEEVAIVAIVFVAAGSILIPIARALAKRIEAQAGDHKSVSPDVTQRLERIERAVDAIAVEVERVSEGQRFVTQLMSERPKPPSIGAGPQ